MTTVVASKQTNKPQCNIMDKQTTGWTRFYSALPSRFSAAPHRVVAHNPAVRAAPPHRRTYLIGAILRRQCVGDAATKRSFFEFSLCLSRACLGKCVVFSIEFARQKRVKIAPSLQRRWCRSAILPRSQSPDGTAEQHRTYSGEYILETAETSATRVS
jgi:hypothetical protein